MVQWHCVVIRRCVEMCRDWVEKEVTISFQRVHGKENGSLGISRLLGYDDGGLC